ncbi:DNA-binding protein [candidate division WOR-3 bacterium]|nr:DNA-binding protein [candidate division WOR-3 bacterium]
MKEYSDGERYLLRFDRGEEVIGALLKWASERKPDGAALTGLGAVEEPRLGYFDAVKKSYINKDFEGEYEIASLAGNLAWDQETGDPMVHIHAVLSGPNFLAFGGHLYSARVSGTVEVSVQPVKTRLVRKYKEELNLKLLD